MMPVPTEEQDSLCQNGGETKSVAEYKSRYRELKRQLKALLFEQESYQDELHKAQRKLLKVNRDKSFLLDRLLQYESVDLSSSDDERTASSSEDEQDLEQNYWEKGAQVVKPPTENRVKKKIASGSSSSQSVQSKGVGKTTKKHAAEGVEKARCKHVDNGKSCPKLVSKRIKSGFCFTHRSLLKAEKQALRQSKEDGRVSAETPQNDLTPENPYFNFPNPMISGGIPSDLPQHSNLTDQVYRLSTNLAGRPRAGSPGPGDFQTNIYEGDDDLVIDLPE